jgi:hypothetical protein
MTSIRLVLYVLFCGGLLMNSPASASGPAPLVPPPLSGQWGGDRMILTLDATGGRIEMDCASGTLQGPIIPGGDGKFQAQGSFVQHRGGPDLVEQQPDAKNAPALTHYAGELQDGVLKLSILAPGSSTPQVFNLRQGARLKLMRCY